MTTHSASEAMHKAKKAFNKTYEGFDVVCTIGRVEYQALGDFDSPMTAAFNLIAKHGSPGVYHFPGPDGSVTVTVEYGSQEEPA